MRLHRGDRAGGTLGWCSLGGGFQIRSKESNQGANVAESANPPAGVAQRRVRRLVRMPPGGAGRDGYLAWRRLRLAQTSSAPKATIAAPTSTVGAELVPVKGSCPPAVVVVAPPTPEVVVVAPATVLVVVTLAGQVGSGSGCECLVRLFSVGSVQCARAMISGVEPSSVGASIRT